MALKLNDAPTQFFAWAHRNGTNNCTKEQAYNILKEVCIETYQGVRLLMHNAKFDITVLQKNFELRPNYSAIDDSMIAAFLHNPYEVSLALKPLAERYLERKPEERDMMGEWLCANIANEHGKKLSTSPKSDNFYAAYTAYAPPELAGPYAVADVDMTYELFRQLDAYIEATNMRAAYAREIALLPILVENELDGVQTDAERLEEDFTNYSNYIERLDGYIASALGDKNLNIDSDADFLEALLRNKIVDPNQMKYTATGKLSVSSKNLVGAFLDERWKWLISYRSQLATSLRTFMLPWCDMIGNTGGKIYTSWNQVRGIGGGSRTGRFSSTPNFMNIPKVEKIKIDDVEYDLHELVQRDFPEFEAAPLPRVRSYIVPDYKDWVLIGRDYSQQELRIEAHFANEPGPGLLIRKYLEDPKFDLHKFVQDTLKYTFGIELSRKNTKITNFRITYGGGAKGVSEALGVPLNEAKKIRNAVLSANTDLAYLYTITKRRDEAGEPIRTWGGRWYYTEPSKEINGRMVNFAYKLVNYLIQGSAADCTKQAWVNIGMNTKTRKTKISVHDEFLVSCPREVMVEEMSNLRRAMEDVRFDLPMLTDGKWSEHNWDSMVKYEED